MTAPSVPALLRFALPLAAAAAAGCFSYKPPTIIVEPVTARFADAGLRAMREDAPEKAVRLYESGLERARALDDDSAIGRLAYNLAACRLEMGDFAGARTAASESIRALVRKGRSAGEARALEVRIVLREDRLDEAAALGKQTLLDPSVMRRKNLRAEVLTMMAEIAGRKRDAMDARRLVETARSIVRSDATPALLARIEQADGRTCLLEDNPAGAAGAFEREAEQWRLAAQPERIPRALLDAAQAHQNARKPVESATCYFRAARSLAGQQAWSDALRALERGRAAHPGLDGSLAEDYQAMTAVAEAGRRQEEPLAPEDTPGPAPAAGDKR